MSNQSWLPDIFGRDGKFGSEGKSDPFYALRNRIERAFDEFPTTRAWASAEGVLAAKLDVSETDTEICVTVELPGVDKSDVEVTLADSMLTIRGEKRQENVKEGERFHRTERSYGMFERAISTPEGVDPEKVKASMTDGVLVVTMPKPADAKAKRRRIRVDAE